ncbi:MAG: Rieske (2Fe-2S) protein [Chloroflexota bacterium]|nr:Rieske (2Fe-2S) protein [Chloroflexota bacterium]
MNRHVVARLREFPPGSRRIVEVGGRSIGVFNVRGELLALRSSCPHQGAPLCLGIVLGRTDASKPYELTYHDDQDVIKCPWHGWEFDIRTGRSIFNPHRVRVRSYEVTVEQADAPDPSVETFDVTIEDGLVVLHL